MLHGDWIPSKRYLDLDHIKLIRCIVPNPRLSLDYEKLNITLVRVNARTLLARCAGYSDGPDDEFLIYVFHICVSLDQVIGLKG